MEKRQEIELDFVDLLFYLKKKLLVIAAVTLLCTLLGLLITVFAIPNKYTASTRIYVLNRSSDAVVYSDIQLSDKLLNDYKVLITGRNVTKQVVQDLQLNMSYETLASAISVTAPDDTRVVQITVEHTDPVMAAKIADAVCATASTQIQSIMDVDAVKIVYKAEVPAVPSSPNIKTNTVLSFFVGLAIALIALCVVYALDDTIRSEEDVERYLGLSTLGAIPASTELGNKAKKSIAAQKKLGIKKQGGAK